MIGFCSILLSLFIGACNDPHELAPQGVQNPNQPRDEMPDFSPVISNAPEPDSDFEKKLRKATKEKRELSLTEIQSLGFTPGIEQRDSKTGNTPLQAAVLNNQLVAVKYLLEKGADVNALFQLPGNPLINGYSAVFAAAIIYQNTEMVKLLIKHNANLRIGPNKEVEPVLYWVALGRDLTILEQFLKADPSLVDWRPQRDGTVLHSMVRDIRNVDVIRMLLRYNANKRLPNKAGQTAWDFAHADVKKAVPELNPDYVN